MERGGLGAGESFAGIYRTITRRPIYPLYDDYAASTENRYVYVLRVVVYMGSHTAVLTRLWVDGCDEISAPVA